MNLSQLTGALQGISQKLVNAYNLNHSMQTRIDELEALNADLQTQLTQLRTAQSDPVIPDEAEQALSALDQSASAFAASQAQSQDAQPVVPPEAEQVVNEIAETAQAMEADAQQTAQPEQQAA